jgi:hypothetical protein
VPPSAHEISRPARRQAYYVPRGHSRTSAWTNRDRLGHAGICEECSVAKTRQLRLWQGQAVRRLGTHPRRGESASSGAAPGSSFPITISGSLKSSGYGGVCLGHRKIEGRIFWRTLPGTPNPENIGPIRAVFTDSSGRFPMTINVTSPPGAGVYLGPANATFEKRRYQGKSVGCEETEPHLNTQWDIFPEGGWSLSGEENPD